MRSSCWEMMQRVLIFSFMYIYTSKYVYIYIHMQTYIHILYSTVKSSSNEILLLENDAVRAYIRLKREILRMTINSAYSVLIQVYICTYINNIYTCTFMCIYLYLFMYIHVFYVDVYIHIHV
jgi:hypothetical protein